MKEKQGLRRALCVEMVAGRWREEERASERSIGGVSKGGETHGGGLVSESGGPTRSCHLISGRDITAHFSFLLGYQRSGVLLWSRREEPRPTRVSGRGTQGTAFRLTQRESEVL